MWLLPRESPISSEGREREPSSIPDSEQLQSGCFGQAWRGGKGRIQGGGQEIYLTTLGVEKEISREGEKRGSGERKEKT